MYRSVILSDRTGWSGSAQVLTTSFERLIGLSGSRGHSVMLLTRSIHTFTMTGRIGIAVLDLDGLVLSRTSIEPRRVADFGTKRWVIEAHDRADLPTPGTRIVATTMPEPCLER